MVVSGKLRAQRAKSMKFKDGYMIATGFPAQEYIDSATRSVLMRQGVLGVQVHNLYRDFKRPHRIFSVLT